MRQVEQYRVPDDHTAADEAYCSGCGDDLPYAERHACGACGAYCVCSICIEPDRDDGCVHCLPDDLDDDEDWDGLGG